MNRIANNIKNRLSLRPPQVESLNILTELADKLPLTKTHDLQALELALRKGQPEIFNSDQGSQFTSNDFTTKLLDNKIDISMDGKGRVFDNIFVERLWRTVKYEEVYLKDYTSVSEARKSIEEYFSFYNNERPHQSLEYKTPYEIYSESKAINNNIKPLLLT
jgi:putative transposase